MEEGVHSYLLRKHIYDEIADNIILVGEKLCDALNDPGFNGFDVNSLCIDLKIVLVTKGMGTNLLIQVVSKFHAFQQLLLLICKSGILVCICALVNEEV